MDETSAKGPPVDKRTVRRSTREEFLNVPNMLTLARIGMIPPVMLLLVWDTPKTSFYAAVLFGLAAFTDWLDGWLARRNNLVSMVGKLLDPLADKLIVMATLIIAAELHRIPGWFVVLLLSREIAITGLRSMASKEGLEIAVVETGKWKTALQLCGLIALLVHYSYRVDFFVLERVVHFNALGIGLLTLSLVFSLVSAVTYFVRFLKAVAARKAGAR